MIPTITAQTLDKFMVTLAEIMALPDPVPLKPKPLKHYTDSQAGYACRVPKAEHRDVKESVIQKEIINYLKSRGAWVIKVPGSHLVGSSDKTALVPLLPGTPDLLACYKGRFLGIEVKAAKKGVRVKGEQVAQGKAIQRAGGWWLVAWKVEQVEELLNSVDAVL